MDKKNLLLSLFLSATSVCVGQVNIPINKGQRSLTGIAGPIPSVKLKQQLDGERLRLRNSKAQELYKNDLNEKRSGSGGDSIPQTTRMFYRLPKIRRNQIDAVIKEQFLSYKDVAIEQTVDQLNEQTSRWHAIISGGTYNILRNGDGSPVGNFTVGLHCRVGEFKQTTNYRIDPHYIYVAWSTTTAKSEDTSNVLKTIVFPELTKSDFIVGWHHDVIDGSITRSWAAEVSLATYKDTTGKKLFRSENFLAGYKISFSGSLPSINVPAGFQAFGYYNIINIDPKYDEGYHTITGDIPIHNTFHCLGLRIQAEISGATLFFNGKYILNPHEQVTSPDLVRFVYTIGTLVAL